MLKRPQSPIRQHVSCARPVRPGRAVRRCGLGCARCHRGHLHLDLTAPAAAARLVGQPGRPSPSRRRSPSARHRRSPRPPQPGPRPRWTRPRGGVAGAADRDRPPDGPGRDGRRAAAGRHRRLVEAIFEDESGSARPTTFRRPGTTAATLSPPVATSHRWHGRTGTQTLAGQGHGSGRLRGSSDVRAESRRIRFGVGTSSDWSSARTPAKHHVNTANVPAPVLTVAEVCLSRRLAAGSSSLLTAGCCVAAPSSEPGGRPRRRRLLRRRRGTDRRLPDHRADPTATEAPTERRRRSPTITATATRPIAATDPIADLASHARRPGALHR